MNRIVTKVTKRNILVNRLRVKVNKCPPKNPAQMHSIDN